MKLSIRGFAASVAVLWGLVMLLTGLANMLWPAYGTAFLEVMGSVYPGYDAAAGGIGNLIVGTVYGAVDGGILAAVFAWLYNFFAA